MKSIWCNKISSREREPRAVLVTEDGEAHRFTGESIPDVCRADKIGYEKAGKWSNSTFEVLHRDSTSFVSWRQDWETGLTWPQVSLEEAFMWLSEKAPGLSFEGFKRFIEATAPKTLERWKKREDAEREFAETRPLQHKQRSEDLCQSIRQKLDDWQEETEALRSSAERMKAELRCVRDRTDKARKLALKVASEARELADECAAKQKERQSFCSGAFDALDGLTLD